MAASGGLRRGLLRLREAAQDLHSQIRADFSPMEFLELHSFREGSDLQKFQVTTDTVLGGRSTSSFTLKPYKTFTAGCFSGCLDFTHDEDIEGRGGFASFRTKPDERVRDLSAFEAFELRIKTDGRPYIANFKCADHSVEQLWQAQLVTPKPYVWTSVALPFRDLRLTRRGRVELVQVDLNRETVNGFGVLLADGSNGPFRFEIQYVRALRRVDPGQWQSGAERAFIEAGASGVALPPNMDSDTPTSEERQPPMDLPADSVLSGSPPTVQPPTPPPSSASREEWAAWYRKLRAASKVS